MLERIWNKDLAGHPLNWLILLVMAVIIMFVIDLLHTASGHPKPVTEAKERAAKQRHNSASGEATATSETGTMYDNPATPGLA